MALSRGESPTKGVCFVVVVNMLLMEGITLDGITCRRVARLRFFFLRSVCCVVQRSALSAMLTCCFVGASSDARVSALTAMLACCSKCFVGVWKVCFDGTQMRASGRPFAHKRIKIHGPSTANCIPGMPCMMCHAMCRMEIPLGSILQKQIPGCLESGFAEIVMLKWARPLHDAVEIVPLDPFQLNTQAIHAIPCFATCTSYRFSPVSTSRTFEDKTRVVFR